LSENGARTIIQGRSSGHPDLEIDKILEDFHREIETLKYALKYSKHLMYFKVYGMAKGIRRVIENGC